MDNQDAEARALLERALRSAQGVLQEASGPARPPHVTVWCVSPQQLQTVFARRSGMQNTGAATVVSSRFPNTYMRHAYSAVTAEGEAAQQLHLYFVTAHEHTHAWLNDVLSRDIEEGFANWIAARAMMEVKFEGLEYQTMQRLAVIGMRMRQRSGQPCSVQDLLNVTGYDAYSVGAALFMWMHSERGTDAAFSSTATRVLMSPSFTPAQVLRGLRSQKGDGDPEARFSAWLSQEAARHQWWWMPVGIFGIAERDQDTAIVADPSAVVMMSFAHRDHLPAAAVKLDEQFGSPPLARVQRMEATVRGEGIGFSPMLWSKLTLGPDRSANAPQFACSFVTGGMQREKNQGVAAPMTPLQDGDTIEFACEGADVVIRRIDDDRTELHRWKNAACVPALIASYGVVKDDTVPVVEFKVKEYTAK